MSSRHVRCASDSSRICASQGFDAKCHNRKSPSYSITSSLARAAWTALRAEGVAVLRLITSSCVSLRIASTIAAEKAAEWPQRTGNGRRKWLAWAKSSERA
jgi:hypothetical protein